MIFFVFVFGNTLVDLCSLLNWVFFQLEVLRKNQSFHSRFWDRHGYIFLLCCCFYYEMHIMMK